MLQTRKPTGIQLFGTYVGCIALALAGIEGSW